MPLIQARQQVEIKIKPLIEYCYGCRMKKTLIQRVGGSEYCNRNKLTASTTFICRNKKCSYFTDINKISTWVIVGSAKYRRLKTQQNVKEEKEEKSNTFKRKKYAKVRKY